uniref:AMP-binding enzyme n=1 Tax=Candidatus Planktophila sp. TaxID=2175601 RepID=UPI00404B5F6F
DKTGERVQAYVKAAIPAPSADEIIAHCRTKMTAYKIPKEIIFVDELPKSPIGKILRRTLRDQAIGASKNTASKGA